MKTLALTKDLPLSDKEGQEQYYIIVPGRLMPGNDDTEDPFTGPSPNMLTPEQMSFLTGSVLHSLVEPGTTMILSLNLEDGEIMELPILPLKLGDLEPRAVYDPATYELRGTRLRLPAVPTNANRVFFHQSIGNPPKLDTLYLSYAGDLTRANDDAVIRTRFAPGMSGLAMGGEYTLTSTVN